MDKASQMKPLMILRCNSRMRLLITSIALVNGLVLR